MDNNEHVCVDACVYVRVCIDVGVHADHASEQKKGKFNGLIQVQKHDHIKPSSSEHIPNIAEVGNVHSGSSCKFQNSW